MEFLSQCIRFVYQKSFFKKVEDLYLPTDLLCTIGLTNRWIFFTNMKSNHSTAFRSAASETWNWSYQVKTGALNMPEELKGIFELMPAEKEGLLSSIHGILGGLNNHYPEKSTHKRHLQGPCFSYLKQICLPNNRTKTICLTGSALSDESGITGEIKGTCEVIPEQYSNDLQRFFELSADLLCICDFEGNILSNSSSLEKITGLSAAELRGMKIQEILRPEDDRIFRRQLQLLFDSGKTENQECSFLLPDDRRLRLQWTAAFDEQSNRIFTIAQDITGKEEVKHFLL